MSNEVDRKELICLLASEHSKTEIAQIFGINRTTLYRYLKKSPITKEEVAQYVYQNEQAQEKLAIDDKPEVKQEDLQEDINQLVLMRILVKWIEKN